MYSGRGFREWEIGDIDVIEHNGTFHLFHLVIPNHDYIAHAVSDDGINWTRVKNAIYTSEPGGWDDDMVWTMHISIADEGGFEMFYTGLSLKEHGLVQRIGRATSDDLYDWTKDEAAPFPLEATGKFYESKSATDRGWVSFRDPFIYRDEEREWLLMAARTSHGPINRRGCVGVFERNDREFTIREPLFHPHMYDDVECPCLVKVKSQYYLIGSMREDIKVHYWYTPSLDSEFLAYSNNVLLPKGNYAARVTQVDGVNLLYCFYMDGKDVMNSTRYLPPPKELDANDSGQLVIKSFSGWDKKITTCLAQEKFPSFTPLMKNPTAVSYNEKESHLFTSRSGYEIFGITKSMESFIWEGTIKVIGRGKCGLIFDCDENGNGYYISLDTLQGLAQIRAWGFNEKDIYNNFVYNNLQSNVFEVSPELEYHFKLIHFGDYIELSINGEVTLSLIDKTYNHRYVGVYVESAEVILSDSKLCALVEPHTMEIG